jgi:hypothetical protein
MTLKLSRKTDVFKREAQVDNIQVAMANRVWTGFYQRLEFPARQNCHTALIRVMCSRISCWCCLKIVLQKYIKYEILKLYLLSVLGVVDVWVFNSVMHFLSVCMGLLWCYFLRFICSFCAVWQFWRRTPEVGHLWPKHVVKWLININRTELHCDGIVIIILDSKCNRMLKYRISLGVGPHRGLMPRYLLLFDSYSLAFYGAPSLDHRKHCF